MRPRQARTQHLTSGSLSTSLLEMRRSEVHGCTHRLSDPSKRKRITQSRGLCQTMAWGTWHRSRQPNNACRITCRRSPRDSHRIEQQRIGECPYQCQWEYQGNSSLSILHRLRIQSSLLRPKHRETYSWQARNLMHHSTFSPLSFDPSG